MRERSKSSLLLPQRKDKSYSAPILSPPHPTGTNGVINQSHSPVERDDSGPEACRGERWNRHNHSRNKQKWKMTVASYTIVNITDPHTFHYFLPYCAGDATFGDLYLHLHL